MNRLTRKTPLQSCSLATHRAATKTWSSGRTTQPHTSPAKPAGRRQPTGWLQRAPAPSRSRGRHTARAAEGSAPLPQLPGAPSWWRAPLSPPSQTRKAFSAARSPGASWWTSHARRLESVPRNSDGSLQGEKAAAVRTPHTLHAQAQRLRPRPPAYTERGARMYAGSVPGRGAFWEL